MTTRRERIMDLSRRGFIKLSTAAAAGRPMLAAQASGAPAAPLLVAQAGRPAPAGFDPADPSLKFDLVIAGGDVLDPSQNLRGKHDVGIKNGQVATIAPSIPADRSVQRIDAGGRLVTPGLVDLHSHYCPYISGIGLVPDELVGITATTTGVSPGDAGYNTFSAFRRWVMGEQRTRLFAFV